MQNFKDNPENGDFYEMPNVPLMRDTTDEKREERHGKRENGEKAGYIVILGLYAGLFTIFSVTVQIFEFVCDIEAIVGLLLLLAGILLGFILTLDAIASGWSKNKTNGPSAQSIFIAGIIIAMIAIGLYLVKNTRDTWHCPPSPQLTYIK